MDGEIAISVSFCSANSVLTESSVLIQRSPGRGRHSAGGLSSVVGDALRLCAELAVGPAWVRPGVGSPTRGRSAE